MTAEQRRENDRERTIALAAVKAAESAATAIRAAAEQARAKAYNVHPTNATGRALHDVFKRIDALGVNALMLAEQLKDAQAKPKPDRQCPPGMRGVLFCSNQCPYCPKPGRGCTAPGSPTL